MYIGKSIYVCILLYTLICIIYICIKVYIHICIDQQSSVSKYIYTPIYIHISNNIRRSLNKFPDFFRVGTFIDSSHMKL